jgi:hypothetical protein
MRIIQAISKGIEAFMSPQQHGRYSYAISGKARQRIHYALGQYQSSHQPPWRTNYQELLAEVQDALLLKYGTLRASPYEAARASSNPVIEHFASWSDEEALAFLEMCFHTRAIGFVEDAKTLAETINMILEEEGIGYELTAPKVRETDEPGIIHGRKIGKKFHTDYPKFIKKGERTVHDIAVKPALTCLSDSRFSVANSEMLKAFDEVRKGDYADAITSCGSSFESVLKTICTAKNWTFDQNKDACATLVEICRTNGLFPPPYTEPLKAVGTIRNKLGDAHGKGPNPMYVAERDHADHMIAFTCSHIELLVKLAKLWKKWQMNIPELILAEKPQLKDYLKSKPAPLSTGKRELLLRATLPSRRNLFRFIVATNIVKSVRSYMLHRF